MKPIQLDVWSLKMIYRIVTYGRDDERMRGSLFIPEPLVKWAKYFGISGFGPEDDGLGEYLLDESHIRKLAQYLHFKPEPERFFYYIEPYTASESNGLQPEGLSRAAE